MFRSPPAPVSLALAALVSTHALAQQAPVLEVIEVIGRSDPADYSFSSNKIRTDLLDIGQSISVVTHELMQEQGMLRLNDITPFVAGANEFSVYNDITIRGFRNYDDRRVNGLRSYNNFWSQDVIAHVDRIEVVKGSAAAMFGDASPGGVVNVVTKKPLEESQTELFARAGSFDERYLSLDTTGSVSDELLYRLNVAREDSDTFRNGVFNENTVVAPSLTYRPFSGTTVNLDVVYVDSGSVLDRGQPNFRNSQSLGAVPIETSLTQPGDGLDYESTNVTVSLDQRVTDNWRLAIAYNTMDYDERLVEHSIWDFLSDSEIQLGFGDRSSEAEVDNISAYLTGEFSTGAIEHNLVFGVDRVERSEQSQEVVDPFVDTVDLNDLANLNRPRDIATYNTAAPDWSPWGGRMENTGLYIQDQMTLGRWQVMLGLRRDDFDVESLGNEVGRNPWSPSDRLSLRSGGQRWKEFPRQPTHRSSGLRP